MVNMRNENQKYITPKSFKGFLRRFLKNSDKESYKEEKCLKRANMKISHTNTSPSSDSYCRLYLIKCMVMVPEMDL